MNRRHCLILHLHLHLTLTLILLVPGCSRTADTPASTTVDAAELMEIPALESLPIAADASFQSPPAEDGMTAGEMRELSVLKMNFCWCPPGTFTMGSDDDDPDRQLNELQTEVTLTKGFWLQQTEVTQAQYEAIMGVNPSHFKGPEHPVESLTWDEATLFCERLSSLEPEKSAGNVYRLPTEAEWEYACRAGSSTAFSFGNNPDELGDYAWYNANSDRSTHPVGQKQPNAWNLHDMHGNVWEWCNDWLGDYSGGSVTDPQGAASGAKRVLRGGGWFFVPMYHRSAYRDAYVSSARYVGLGFRVVAQHTSIPVQAAE